MGNIVSLKDIVVEFDGERILKEISLEIKGQGVRDASRTLGLRKDHYAQSHRQLHYVLYLLPR